MENRDRDKVSREDIGNEKDDSNAEFGKNIGRPEDLNEPNRRSGNLDDSGIEEELPDQDSGRTSERSRSEH